VLKVLSDILLALDAGDLPALVLLDFVDGLRHGKPLYRPTSSSTLDSRDRRYSGPGRTWSAAGHYVEVRAGSTASSPAPNWYSQLNPAKSEMLWSTSDSGFIRFRSYRC